MDPSSGTISGEPTEIDTKNFTARVTDWNGDNTEKGMSISIGVYSNIKGDVDGDCRVNVIDIIVLNNCLIFDEECCPDSPEDNDVLCCREDVCPPDEDMLWRADCNGPLGNCDGDGEWNVLDAVKIANLILQLDECP